MANQSDFVVRLEGKDNLSQTIKAADEALKGMAKESTDLEKLEVQFRKIERSTMPVQKKLKATQRLLAEMNNKNLDASPLYMEMASAAGEYKDAVADASQMVRALSSDNLKLDTAVEAVKGLVGAVQGAAGAYVLLGGSEKEAAEITAKMTALTNAANGIQTVANSLNSRSALISGIKALQARAAAKAVVAETAATKGATIAQRAFNAVAKANPYVLLASAVAAIVTALYAYTKHTGDAKKQTELQAAAMEQAQRVVEEYGSTFSSMASSTIAKYKLLQAQWVNLTTEHQKNEWIKANASAFKDLGLQITTVNDADKWMIRQSANVIKALQLRAEAAALAKQYEKALAEATDITPDAKGDDDLIAGIDVTLATQPMIDQVNEAYAPVLEAIEKKKAEAAQLMGGTITPSAATGGNSNGGTITAMPNLSSMAQMPLNIAAKSSSPVADGITKLQSHIAELTAEFGKNSYAVTTWTNKLKEAQTAIGLINMDDLRKGMQGIDMHPSDDGEKTAKMLGDIKNHATSAGQSLQGLGQAFSAIADKGPAAKAGAILAAVGSIVAAFASALAEDTTTKTNIWAFIAAAVASVATLGTLVGQMRKFSTGGIVGGSSYHGDNVPILANKGEMVLNSHQQRRMWDILSGSGAVGGANGKVEFVIKGDTLQGALNNYNRKMAKIR